MKATKDVATSQSEMKIRDFVYELENGCPVEEQQRIGYGWMLAALWCGSIAAVVALVLLYLVWR
jgi:hypothetical protein